MLMQRIPILTAIASVLVSFGLAQASAEDLTVDDVLKMWSERQAELDAVEINWIEKVSQGQNRSTTTCSLSLGAGSSIRYERDSSANFKSPGNSLARPGLAISAFDGKRNASFTSSRGPKDHHRGIEFDAEVYDELPNYYLHPLLFYYRPLLVVPVAFSVEDHVATEPVELKLVERNAVLDGTTCLIVESVSNGPTPYINRYWVDASKQGLILKHVASSGGSKKTEMRIKYNKDPEHG